MCLVTQFVIAIAWERISEVAKETVANWIRIRRHLASKQALKLVAKQRAVQISGFAFSYCMLT